MQLSNEEDIGWDNAKQRYYCVLCEMQGNKLAYKKTKITIVRVSSNPKWTHKSFLQNTRLFFKLIEI